MEKKTICVDFDGVIAQYDGFKGNDIFGDPIDGVQSAMEVLKKKGFTIIIFTTHTASSKLKKYLNDNHITYDYINENPDQPKGSNSRKPIADIYLDDRAICFKGNWKYALESIASFIPWNSQKIDEKKEFEKAFDNYKKMTKEYALCNS